MNEPTNEALAWAQEYLKRNGRSPRFARDIAAGFDAGVAAEIGRWAKMQRDLKEPRRDGLHRD